MKTLKKQILSLILFGATIISNAQISGWETGVTLSGGVSDIITTNIQPNGADEAKSVNESIRPRFYYSAGVYGRKFFKESYGVQVGVQYSSFAFGPETYTFQNFQGEDIGTGKDVIRYNYVEIPIQFVYKKDIGKISVGAFAGASAAIMVQSYYKSVSRIEGNKNVSKDNYKDYSRPVNIFVDAGAFFRYKVTEKFAIDAKPFFRMGALPFLKKQENPNFDALFIAGGLNVATVWMF